jgi:hypothetical protein
MKTQSKQPNAKQENPQVIKIVSILYKINTKEENKQQTGTQMKFSLI